MRKMPCCWIRGLRRGHKIWGVGGLSVGKGKQANAPGDRGNRRCPVQVISDF